MRRLSLTARQAHDEPSSAEVEVLLLEIAHPDLPAPIRLSTDPTERLSTDPLVYGTRSAWRGADPASEPWLWAVASALLPSDMEDAPAEARIALDLLDQELVRLVRLVTTRATVAMAVVLASSPDLVEAEWDGMALVSHELDAGEVVLSLSREPVEADPWPALRFSRDRFPGLR